MKTSRLAFFLLLASGCSGGGGGSANPTPTPLPTPTPGTVGCRQIAVSAGKDGNDLDDSVYYTTALGETTDTSEFLDADGWRAAGPLTLCAGAVTANKASLTLSEDVTIAVALPLSNCLCRQYLAAGTTGALYCGAHSDALDFTVRRDSMGAGAGGPETIVDGAAVTDEGSVRVSFQSKVANIDANAAACTPAACDTALAAETPFAVLYTSGAATSEFTNPEPNGTDASVSVSGHAFDDDPADGTPDCEDWFGSGGTIGALAGAAGHDEDNADVNKDVVTIERVAE